MPTTPPDLRPILASVEPALADFLTRLLGDDAALRFGAPAPGVDAPAADEAVVLVSPACTVVLAAAGASLLAEAAHGEALDATDPRAAEVLKTLSADAVEAVRAAGTAAPDFASEPAGAALPQAPWHLPFSLTVAGKTVEGFVLFDDAPTVAPAAFPDLGAEVLQGDGAAGDPFDLLADVELEVTVELGRRRLPLADVLRLTAGSVIELEKLIGEPLDVYANGRLIAEGEAVVIDEQFGIRITRLMTRRKGATARTG